MAGLSIVQLAWLTTIPIGLFSIGILGVIFALRIQRHYHAVRQGSFCALWHPILCRSMVEEIEVLPSLDRRDHDMFLRLWVTAQESLAGEARERLNRLALRLEMIDNALRLSQRTRLGPRLVAITALGHLQAQEAWDQLHRLVFHKNPTLSLTAARSLVRIDAEKALAVLVPFFGTRRDWSPVKVIQILKETEADLAAPLLARTALTAHSEDAARLIRLLEAIRGAVALPLIRDIVEARPDDAYVVPASLRLFGQCRDPRDLPRLRQYVTHDNWVFRLHAAAGLGKMGTREDESRLIAMLTDDQWWVRYRAAEGLSRLPFMTQGRLSAIRAQLAPSPIAGILDPFIFPSGLSARRVS